MDYFFTDFITVMFEYIFMIRMKIYNQRLKVSLDCIFLRKKISTHTDV